MLPFSSYDNTTGSRGTRSSCAGLWFYLYSSVPVSPWSKDVSEKCCIVAAFSCLSRHDLHPELSQEKLPHFARFDFNKRTREGCRCDRHHGGPPVPRPRAPRGARRQSRDGRPRPESEALRLLRHRSRAAVRGGTTKSAAARQHRVETAAVRLEYFCTSAQDRRTDTVVTGSNSNQEISGARRRDRCCVFSARNHTGSP